MQFVVRTVFISTLGKSYLGISGLFSNILSMMSLAEMGVGSAIIFKLYDPLAHSDEKRIAVLMNFYKVVYRYIGLAISLIGLCIIPLLPLLINDYDKLNELNLNAIFIYVLYLLDAVSSYLFFAYKSAIIKADQKEYKINIIGYFVTVISSIVQILCLVLIHSFELYVIILIVKTVIQNIIVARYADKNYPYIKGRSEEHMDKKEIQGIFKDCGALFIYKVNNVVLKSTDNIVLSAFRGLDSVALYSNYYIFYTTITGLFNKIFNSVGHSIGNLHTTKNPEKEYQIFESTILISAILGGTAFVGIFAVSDEFIKTWIGNEWTLPQPFALLMGVELFTASMKYVLSKYRTAYGLFRQGWARPLAGIIINLAVSIVLVKPLGICGVLIGTIAADWATFVWYDPLILHKYGFSSQFPLKIYYLKFIKYFATSLLLGIIDFFVCTNFLTGYGWLSVIVHTLICGITTPPCLILVSIHTQEAKYVLQLGSKGFKKFKKKTAKK